MIMPWWPGGGDCVAVWTPLVFGYPSTTVSISQQPMREVGHTCVAYINPSRPSDARNVIISSDDGLLPDNRQAIN